MNELEKTRRSAVIGLSLKEDVPASKLYALELAADDNRTWSVWTYLWTYYDPNWLKELVHDGLLEDNGGTYECFGGGSVVHTITDKGRAFLRREIPPEEW